MRAPNRRGSLRWRLTITHGVLLALVLALLGVVQYTALRHTLIDARASVFDGDIAAAKTVFTRTTLRNPTPGAAAQRFAADVQNASGRTVSVVVYGPEHTVLATAPAGASIPSVSTATLGTLTGSAAHTPPQELTTSDGTDYLVVVYPIALGNLGAAEVELATPMAPIDRVLLSDFRLLLLGGVFAVVGAMGIGLWLTARSLRPLHRLTATAGRLAAGDLAARSRLSHSSDEVGMLGRAFDEMAERIESAFAAQSASEAQVRRFIADASHELRTPVTSLKGYIDVMRRGAGRDPASLDAILESMQREAERMRLLVLDLLTLARLDANRSLAHDPFDVSAVTGKVLDEGVPNMPSALRRELAPSPLLAVGDAGEFATIARNLLVNACKYAPGAEQTWTTLRQNGQVLLRVHDSGPGIPAADLPHLFERFYRGEKTRAREEGGSGLGLSIVQGLARAMGGDVTIQSAEGAGTTVEVALPAAV